MARLPVLFLLLLLAGCARSLPEAVQQPLPGGGGVSPDAAVSGFFSDLSAALADPTLADAEGSTRWAERLSNYFAPSERVQQRQALRRMLDDLLVSMEQLSAEEQPGEQTQLTFEVRPLPIGVRTAMQSSIRAEVQLLDASLYLKIVRVAGESPQVLWEQTEPLAGLIGRSDGTIPVVRVDDRWFLSGS